MSLQAKYNDVLKLGETLGVKDGFVEEAAGGENPADIVADIKVAQTDFYAKHTVKSGESLSKIAKHYYKDPMKYNAIFEANRDILKSADVIHPGQELTIPMI